MRELVEPVFFKMENIVKKFPWGCKQSLQKLFDIDNSQKEPQAEIWMGAHNNGCSVIELYGKKILLSDFIEMQPSKVLGERTYSKFGQLPYLFKVLAAENALSIQVHPSRKKAKIGFAAEEAAGIPINAKQRNYKDSNHKPELVYAVTPYTAMNGFRECHEIIRFFDLVNIAEFKPLVLHFSLNQTEMGLRTFFKAIMLLNGKAKISAIKELKNYANLHQQDPLFSVVYNLSKQYPEDIGLFSPLILNVLTLQPGEAMFLDAETPHAYIKGVALEVMANSDNVLRAGLTPKHIDVPELISNTRFISKSTANLLLSPINSGGALHYPIEVPDFKFTVYHQAIDLSVLVDSAEILFAINKPLILMHENGDKIIIEKGESAFVPASTKQYKVHCDGCFTRSYN